MRILGTILLTGALTGSTLLLGGATVAAQTKTLQGDAVVVSATIEAIEHGTRTITLKAEDGTYETLQVPPEMTRFNELKVGDKITARYYENHEGHAPSYSSPHVTDPGSNNYRPNNQRAAGPPSAEQPDASADSYDPQSDFVRVTDEH